MSAPIRPPTELELARARTSWLSDAFFAQVAELGQRYKTNPEHFLIVWDGESGLYPGAINRASGARGLNQMMPATLHGLGAPSNFETLAGEAQLPWIERLIAASLRLAGGPFRTASRYYHSNFYPATMGRGETPETVVVAGDASSGQERAAYAANKGLDINGDGRITYSDLDAYLDRSRKTEKWLAVHTRITAAVAALPAPGATWDGAPVRPPPSPRSSSSGARLRRIAPGVGPLILASAVTSALFTLVVHARGASR